MRSNGLTASAYTPVADLDPVLATALLDDLRQRGVAAYTKPVESSATAGFDRPEFRTRVKDRLYVDAAASAHVQDLLTARDPALLDRNEDLTWAQIIAGFDQPLDTEVRPWPVQEDLTTDHPPGDLGAAEAGQGAAAGDVVSPGPDPRNRAGSLGRRRSDDAPEPAPDRSAEDPGPAHTGAFDDADFLSSTSKTTARDDEDRFVPDPPPPLPRLAPHKQVAWLGALGGPLLLLVAALFGLTLPDWLAFLGVVGFIGGFITLVATMGDRDDGDWGSDNGAVV